MSRRSFLRGVGAMFAAAGAANGRAVAPSPGIAGGGFIGSEQGFRTIDGISAAGVAKPFTESPGWKTFHALMARQDRQDARRRQVTAMLGGYPPHIASMHSNAPWFRAQRAMAWEDAQRTTVEAYLARLRSELLGEKPGEAA